MPTKNTASVGKNALMERFPTKKEPPILYHYTTIGGLLGILKEKNIWATNVNYLNDREEFQGVIDLLNKRISKLKSQIGAKTLEEINKLLATSGQFSGGEAFKNAWPPSKAPLYEDFRDVLIRLSRHIYVCSFSRERDQLSQWRAYCRPSGNGFSIGFNRQKLRTIASSHDDCIGLGECLYVKESQMEIVEKIISRSEQKYKNKTRFTVELLIEFLKVAPYFKHERFHEENEWRIIFIPNKDIKFREGDSLVIPYIAAGLTDEKGGLPIESITIGPTVNKKEARLSVEILLEQYGMTNVVEIKESDIPYRGQI